ncbi:hypothetical protein [Arthrobacter sp. H14-L1]|nr:hypothetical protein [Arthrobacter sp. H14-L1]
MNEPASDLSGETIASNVSLVLGEIAPASAVIGEEQPATASRLLGRGKRS